VAALQGLSLRPAGATESVRSKVVARLDDPSEAVRRAAIVASAHLQARDAVPKLLALAEGKEHRTEARLALAVLPDPRAIPIFVASLADPNPDLRYAAQVALTPLRDRASGAIQEAARAGKLTGPAALAAERVLATFKPVTSWKVIAPFPRTTAKLFLGGPSIDFAARYPGAEGQPIAWQPLQGDPRNGRVVLDAFKGGHGDKGGFGYDANGSPDLCAFGFAEVESDRDRPALLLVGSSGTVIVELNGEVVHSVQALAGRRYAPDSDLVRVTLKAGKNRLLVQARQGIGVWCFGVQVSEPSSVVLAGTSGPSKLEVLRDYAKSHDGDPEKGAAIFLDPKGVGCVKCHAAAGRGTATVGPDLTGLASKYDKSEIIRSVLEPSARLATGYQPVVVALADGRVVTGLVRAETGTELELVDADAKVVRVAKDEVVERRTGDVSVMPAGVAETLEPGQFADLIAFLASLKGGTKTK
jgi:putative heme-binding domain-containing protein